MINPNSLSIQYAAETKLLDLVEAGCTTSKLRRQNTNFDQAAKILYFLEALTYQPYIEDIQVNNILECLKETAELYEFPVSPLVNELTPPTINMGLKGPKGDKGDRGEDGGATDFGEFQIISNTIVDTFPISEAYAVRWDYLVNGVSQRAGSILATWTEDGAGITNWGDIGTPDVNGSTGGVEFTTTIVGTNVNLNAIITSGTWDVVGSRYFIPNNGKGTGPISNSLANGKVYVGNASNVATAVSVTGDISITNTGVVSITPNAIVNADVSTTAGIAVTKLAALTGNRAVVTNASGFNTTSTASDVEVSYLSGVTSGIQAQLDSKLDSASGAISPFVTLDATPNRIIASDGAGKMYATGLDPSSLSPIPTGVIVMWSGSIVSIPSGWALCDGSGGRPDLRDRFIAGAGSTYSVGATGGQNSVVLNQANLGSHNHSYIKSGYALALVPGGALEENQGGPGYNLIADDSTESTGSTGGNTAHENRPLFYALAYIQKI
jgi:microcystin-dependent protein